MSTAGVNDGPVTLTGEIRVGRPVLVTCQGYRATPLVVAIAGDMVSFDEPPFNCWPLTLRRDQLRT